ncbi:MAG: RagB/SusD family nutrient uptake outer membrane protein, partial [Bacteroidetes bacterium]|nr:RagB/SusD family nutrient uptake outer membrane protein [Bacteroidota bacterium]
MRNKIIAVALSILLPGLWSCQKYLEETNPSEVTTEFLYTTQDGLQAAVNGLYSMERAQVDDNESSDFVLVHGDAGTDIDFVRAAVNPSVARYRTDVSLPDQGSIRSWWRKWYQIIERTNSIITFGKQAEISDSSKKMILREAYIYRAYSYFWLVRKFDNIWLNLEPTTSQNFENRVFNVATQEEVYKTIVSDLDIAISSFGNDWAARPGQFGLGAALYLRIDVALWQKDYQTAATLSARLINDGPYGLVDPSQVYTQDGRNDTREAIYVMQFDEFAVGGGYFHRLPLVFTTDYKQVPGIKMVSEFGGYGWARIFPNEYLMSLYDSVNDKRWSSWWQHYYTYNDDSYNFSGMPYKLGDTLKYGQNSMLSGSNYFRDASISCKKYWDYIKLPNTLRSYNSIYMFRYSEVYLMAAEAEMQLGNTAQALSYINTLRQSRILPNPNQLITTIDQEVLLEEEARELAFEGKRWFFLKRLGLLVDRVREHAGTTVFRGILATDPAWYSGRTNIQDY